MHARGHETLVSVTQFRKGACFGSAFFIIELGEVCLRLGDPSLVAIAGREWKQESRNKAQVVSFAEYARASGNSDVGVCSGLFFG